MQVAVFPDIEDLTRVYLTARLGKSVTLRRPGDAVTANGAVLLWRGGGSRDRLVDTPLLNVEAWHARDAQALSLCGDAVDYMLALGGTQLEGWQITKAANPGGVASLPDPRFPDLNRYVAMIELRVRGATR